MTLVGSISGTLTMAMMQAVTTFTSMALAVWSQNQPP
jgi:hypothetical protein